MSTSLLVGRVERLQVPRAVLRASWRHVAQRGGGRSEAIVVWAGRVAAGGARVVTAVAPPLDDVRANAHLHHLNTRAHAAMCRWMEHHGLIALSQVHTHPSTWVGHSETDDNYPFAPDDGFWSIVWPRFAKGRVSPTTGWGVHERREGAWHQLSQADVRRRLILLPDSSIATETPLVEVA